jgi:hypothetical protein
VGNRKEYITGLVDPKKADKAVKKHSTSIASHSVSVNFSKLTKSRMSQDSQNSSGY